MAQNIQLMIIDPQRDFCDPHGALYVPGAEEDMKRLAQMVARLKDKIADIHITLDSHRMVDISHPVWWKDARGRNPDPFTSLSAADVRAGSWTTTQPSAYERSLAYLDALQAGGRYPHVIWPYHCLIGDEGHAVMPELSGAIHEWEERYAMADFVTKGSNPWTEHFSAVQAEVPDPADPGTQINAGLVNTLEEADVTVWAGQALSHCLANSMRDVATEFADPALVSKMVLLTDATGNVPGFENYGESFVAELKGRGMRTSTTTDFLA